MSIIYMLSNGALLKGDFLVFIAIFLDGYLIFNQNKSSDLHFMFFFQKLQVTLSSPDHCKLNSIIHRLS